MVVNTKQSFGTSLWCILLLFCGCAGIKDSDQIGWWAYCPITSGVYLRKSEVLRNFRPYLQVQIGHTSLLTFWKKEYRRRKHLTVFLERMGKGLGQSAWHWNCLKGNAGEMCLAEECGQSMYNYGLTEAQWQQCELNRGGIEQCLLWASGHLVCTVSVTITCMVFPWGHCYCYFLTCSHQVSSVDWNMAFCICVFLSVPSPSIFF